MAVGTDVWRNSIDIRFVGTGEATAPTPSASIVTAFKNFMQEIHFPDTTLVELALRIVKQTRPDETTHGEDPPVWESALGLAGTGNTTFGGAHNANFLPKDAAIYCRKTTSGGRSGKMFLRNILTEMDVQAALSGGWQFADHAGGWQTSVFAAAVTANLVPFFAAATPAPYAFAVAHLLHLTKAGDTRAPYSTSMTGLVAERPVWNRAHR
jgi:hypothetical protein